MAQQNKKLSAGSGNRARLEQELLGEALDGPNSAEVDTGRAHHATPWQDMLGSRMHKFSIKQGVRRRHPSDVLHRFNTVVNRSSNIQDYATQSLVYSHQRAELPDEYEKDGESTMLASQFYLPQTAHQNYLQNHQKLMNAVQL